MTCRGGGACDIMSIDGRDAALLTLNDCTANRACGRMRIYCPQHSDGEKRCILEGNDNLDIRQLYAVNSWDDILFNTPNKRIWDCGDEDCTMYCDGNFDKSCVFSNGWKCDDTSSYCYEPTKYPTGLPTPNPVLYSFVLYQCSKAFANLKISTNVAFRKM